LSLWTFVPWEKVHWGKPLYLCGSEPLPLQKKKIRFQTFEADQLKNKKNLKIKVRSELK